MNRRPMSARERLQVMVRTGHGSMTVWSESEVREALDAYRAEVLAEAAGIGRKLSRNGYSAQEIASHLDRLADGGESRG